MLKRVVVAVDINDTTITPQLHNTDNDNNNSDSLHFLLYSITNDGMISSNLVLLLLINVKQQQTTTTNDELW